MADTDRIAEIRTRLEAVEDTDLDHAQRYMVRQAFDANVRHDMAYLLDELARVMLDNSILRAEVDALNSPLYKGWGDA